MTLKKLMKDKAISEDDEKRHQTEVQKATDKAVAKIDQAFAVKEKEIMEL
jgi:ribosome recycling factor